MQHNGPSRPRLRTPRQIAIDRLTSALFVALILMVIGVVYRLGPAEAMSRIADAF